MEQAQHAYTLFGVITFSPGQNEAVLAQYFSSLLLLFYSLAGGIAVLLVIASGYHYIASQGNPAAIEEAKSRILYALGGLVLVFASFLLLSILFGEQFFSWNL